MRVVALYQTTILVFLKRSLRISYYTLLLTDRLICTRQTTDLLRQTSPINKSTPTISMTHLPMPPYDRPSNDKPTRTIHTPQEEAPS